ncbi:hypothetical protein ACQ5SP_06610 [Rhodovulum sp. YNF3179]|uniref:hypothetical protein n=1 Tax=Rhodovulum sp. YNF3179 TaxID=3425127 RepID=UPI003D32DB9F
MTGAGLSLQLRAHLLTLSPADPLPSYAALATALALTPPGRIAQVTGALEASMAQDAAAGRPFIAALVTGRGGRPGRGFFETARAHGRGPGPGESADDWLAAEIARARAHYLRG